MKFLSKRKATLEEIRVALLKDIAKTGSEEEKIVIAKSQKTPPEILVILARDKTSPLVRGMVAKNSNLPPHMLKLLSKDENMYVRGCVTSNKNVTTEILEILAEDQSLIVKLNVWFCKKTTKEIRNLLDQDPNFREFRSLLRIS